MHYSPLSDSSSGLSGSSSSVGAPQPPDSASEKTAWSIGVDEAGRGPVLGPLVVAALAVKRPGILEEIGTRDSKNLTPAQRSAIFRRMTGTPEIIFEYKVVEASDLDSLMEEVSLNVVEVRLFAAAISSLMERLPSPPEGIFLDACDVNEERFGRSVIASLDRNADVPENMQVFSRHKGDSIYPVVSGASIVAKVIRDGEMEKIRQEFGMGMEDMGSGYPADSRTRRFLENWIKEKGVVPPHARRSWKTTRRLVSQYAASQKRLSDFG